MGKFIIKIADDKFHKDYYMEWSTIVDAPVTNGMSLSEFKDYYELEYGKSSMAELEERLKRVKVNGSSGHPPYDKIDGFFEYNRAGLNETQLNKEDILNKYCR